MEQILQRTSFKNNLSPFCGRHNERSYGLVSSGGAPQAHYRLDLQMKLFFVVIFSGVVLFGTVSGVNLRTTYEAKVEEARMHISVARLVTMSIPELQQERI